MLKLMLKQVKPLAEQYLPLAEKEIIKILASVEKQEGETDIRLVSHIENEVFYLVVTAFKGNTPVRPIKKLRLVTILNQALENNV